MIASETSVKALFLIGIATYIAFCGTLYLAGNGKDFNDPFVQVAGSGNASPTQPVKADASKASKSSKRADAKRTTSPSRGSKVKPSDLVTPAAGQLRATAPR